MRLIDADALKSELYKLGMFEDVAEMVNTTINCMPTAYDPDKVFEEIELRKGISRRNIKLNSREENLRKQFKWRSCFYGYFRSDGSALHRYFDWHASVSRPSGW